MFPTVALSGVALSPFTLESTATLAWTLPTAPIPRTLAVLRHHHVRNLYFALRAAARRRLVRELHGGRGDVYHVELLSERFDNNAEAVEVARDQYFSQRGARQLEPPRA
jgi:hypothetical protein